jgi:cytochrome c biogenesis protein CcmG, thiol:disulfide interchange protein DsbE
MLRLIALITFLVPLLAGGCRREVPPAGAGRTAPDAAGDQAGGGAPTVGSSMPAYEAKWLDGRPFRLADRAGKVVLLNIWATWCGPCRYEIPELQKMHEQLAARGFEVIGVSIDDPGSEAQIQQFMRQEKMTYPVVFDPQGRIADLFETTVIPTTALIDRQGRIVWIHQGIVSSRDASLNEALQKAL